MKLLQVTNTRLHDSFNRGVLAAVAAGLAQATRKPLAPALLLLQGFYTLNHTGMLRHKVAPVGHPTEEPMGKKAQME